MTLPATSVIDPSEEMAKLIELLVETERRLEALTEGEVDSVTSLDGRTFLLRRAQEQLRQRDASRQAAILNTLPAHIALLDPEGVILSVNEAWRQFADENLLHALSHAVGSNYLEVCDRAQGEYSSEAPQVAAGIRAVLGGARKEFSIDYPCHSLREKRWFQLTVTPLADGYSAGVVVMHLNITERRLAEETLRASESNLSTAQSIAHVGSWDLELSNTINLFANPLRWSDEMFRIAGYEPGEVEVSNELFYSLVPAAEREPIHRAVAAAIRDRGQYSITHRLVRPNGEVRTVHETAQIYYDVATGHVLRACGTCQDITETKFAEEVLREREERLRAALSASGAGTFRWDFRTSELDWDDSLDLLFGLPPGQTVRSLASFIAAVHPDDRATLMERCQRCEREGADFAMEFRILWPDGTQRWLDDRGKTFFDTAGKPIYMTGACVDITERKDAAAALEELSQRTERRERMLSTALSSMSDFAHIYDRQGRFLFANQPLLDLWGTTLEEAVGKNYREIGYPEALAERLQSAVQKVFETGKNVTGERPYTSPAGLKGFYEYIFSPIFGGEGAVDFVVGSTRDITERKNAENALRASEEEFRTLSEAMPQIVWVTRPDGWTIYLNQQWVDYTGRTIENSLGHEWLQAFHPEDQTPAMDAWLVATATKTTFSMETRIQRADGIYRWWLCRAIPLNDAGGGVLKWIGTGTDIHDLKHAQEQISQQAALLDVAQDAILVKDLQDRIIYWNRGAERAYGWTAVEAVGRTSTELLKEDPLVHHEARAAFFASGRWQGEIVSQTKSGSEITADVRWTLVKDAHGQAKSILAIRTDITGRKKLEAQFLRVQRMESIGTLASGIAHDLNNVLAPIMMSVEMLRDIAKTPEDQSLLGTLEGCVQRGANLIKQVLSFARGVDGRRVPVNVLHIIRDIESIVQDTFPKNISFEIKHPHEVGAVLGDPTQLHQVFMNLCVNSRDAMPLGGKLMVALQNVVVDELYADMNPDAKPGPYIVINVEDTGSGIPLAIQNKIFEPFFTTKEMGKGTGLGLSTTIGIIKSHGGFISLYSEPGRGAQFRVYLPATLSSKAPKGKEARHSLLPHGDGELILVVDDEESIRTVTQKTLERFNYRVLLARNGAEGVAAYAKRGSEIALVLTDMAMPIMDGPALIAALFALNPGVKIVGCSGHASNHSVDKAMGSGIRHFIPKPYSAETLLTKLNELLQKEGQKSRVDEMDDVQDPRWIGGDARDRAESLKESPGEEPKRP